MRINVHAGHAAVGGGAIGAVGLISESVEDRIVKDKVIAMLREKGHQVVDCTVDKGTQSGVLNAIIRKCNQNKADLDISIHFNSGANRPAKDGKTTGTEVYIYNAASSSKDEAQAIVNAIANLGFKNRGVKTSTSLGYLKRTTNPAVLIECCFVDDGDDVALYDADQMAAAIVSGIIGQNVVPKVESKPAESQRSCPFVVKCKVNLNIRKGPGVSYAIASADGCKKNVKYTITEVKGGWGKLKSGAGWINISTSYVTYC